MTGSSENPGFFMASSAWLKSRGVIGKATVRLQRGSSIATALELAIPMLALLLAAIAIGTFALDGAVWWERMIPSLAALPFAIIGIWLAIKRWPRQVKDLAEFNSRVA